jgi:hypothetical protein
VVLNRLFSSSVRPKYLGGRVPRPGYVDPLHLESVLNEIVVDPLHIESVVAGAMMLHQLGLEEVLNSSIYGLGSSLTGPVNPFPYGLG